MSRDQLNDEMAEAAVTLGREHEENCGCDQCEFAFQVYIVACGGQVNEQGNVRWTPEAFGR